MSEQFNEYGPFAVGEICRVVRADNFPELLGREVTIVARRRRLINSITGKPYDGYLTDLFHNGVRIGAPESYLRRRKPPAADSNERMYVQMWRDMADKAPQRVEVPA